MSEIETTLSEKTLDTLTEEAHEQMRSNGTFDDIRERLAKTILEDGKFSEITEVFKNECESFCRRTDLTKDRAKLRRELKDQSRNLKAESAKLLDRLVRNILKEKANDLRKEHNNHVRQILLDKGRIAKAEAAATPPEPEPTPMVVSEDTTMVPEDTTTVPEVTATVPEESIQQRQPSPMRDPTPSPQTRSEDMDLGSDHEEVEAPTWSPVSDLGEHNKDLEIKQECDIDVDDVKPTVPSNHDTKVACNADRKEEEEEKPNLNHDQNHIGDPAANCDGTGDEGQGDDDDDDDVSLDIDDVSSVGTADLKDFDDRIEISDDEASLLGRRKNSKLSIDVLRGDIENLKQAQIVVRPCDVPIPPMDPPQPSAESSDSSNLSRNSTRSRKSNPRYHNSEFSLL